MAWRAKLLAAVSEYGLASWVSGWDLGVEAGRGRDAAYRKVIDIAMEVR